MRDAPRLTAPLQQRVQAWLDGDRLFPADGAALLAALDQVLAGLAGEDARAARAGITAFVGRIQALTAAGALAASDAQPLIEAAALLIAGLSGTGKIERAGPSATRPPGSPETLPGTRPPAPGR